MRSMYVGIWMMPCESWPARLASMQWRMTTSASSGGVPAATSSAAPIACSRSAGMRGNDGFGSGFALCDDRRRFRRPRMIRTVPAVALVLEHERPDGDDGRHERQQLRLAYAEREYRVQAIELDEEAAHRVGADVGPEEHAVTRQARVPVEAPAAISSPREAPRQPYEPGEDDQIQNQLVPDGQVDG